MSWTAVYVKGSESDGAHALFKYKEDARRWARRAHAGRYELRDASLRKKSGKPPDDAPSR